ncbi:MAG: Maf family protein [Firmicutes bacterium]|nr:Maf family protein [Bacillota bacterium]
MRRIILASASPRRENLLRQLGLILEVFPSDIDELRKPSEPPYEVAQRLAVDKVEDVAPRFKDALIIGADTIVVYEDRLMGKPANEEEAYEMVKTLQGKWHEVYTGVAMEDADTRRLAISHEVSRVKMRRLTYQEIRGYVASGEPMGKAGGYAAQGLGAILIERVEGCHYNVVGLPLFRVAYMLEGFGMNLLTGLGLEDVPGWENRKAILGSLDPRAKLGFRGWKGEEKRD